MLPVAVALSSSWRCSRFVLPVLWMLSYYYIMALWLVVCICQRRYSTSMTADIPTKVCSTIKTGSTHCNLRTWGEVCWLRLPWNNTGKISSKIWKMTKIQPQILTTKNRDCLIFCKFLQRFNILFHCRINFSLFYVCGSPYFWLLFLAISLPPSLLCKAVRLSCELCSGNGTCVYDKHLSMDVGLHGKRRNINDRSAHDRRRRGDILTWPDYTWPYRPALCSASF